MPEFVPFDEIGGDQGFLLFLPGSVTLMMRL